MTHDELIDVAIVKDLNKLIRKQMKIIDAVIKLHRAGNGEASRCEACCLGFDCPTIQAIVKEL